VFIRIYSYKAKVSVKVLPKFCIKCEFVVVIDIFSATVATTTTTVVGVVVVVVVVVIVVVVILMAECRFITQGSPSTVCKFQCIISFMWTLFASSY
jgi:hypothetical protein